MSRQRLPPGAPGPGEQAPLRREAARALSERWDILLVIAAGGALGTLARWALTAQLQRSDEGLPWGTWTENVTGGFLLGALMVYVLDVWPPHRYLRPFLGVGVLGGYTTFSTAMLESHALTSAGRLDAALLYLGATLGIGLLAVWLGVLTARATVAAARRRRRHHRDDEGKRTPR